MQYYISHNTAIEYWRMTGKPCETGERARCRAKLPTTADSVGVPRHSNPWGLIPPFDLMIGNSKARKNSRMVRNHTFARAITSRCFVGINGTDADTGKTETLFVSTPEFCFLQMAGCLSLVKLIQLGFELCGSYRIMPVEMKSTLPGAADVRAAAARTAEASKGTRGFTSDGSEPLTSVAKLKSFIAGMTGASGVRQARKALRYIRDGSASPMETILTMLLSLPYKYGGYGLPFPKLNGCIDASVKGKHGQAGQDRYASDPRSSRNPRHDSSSCSHYYCDLLWPTAKLAVEYDSDLFHTGSARIAHDSKRRNALTSLGITVITVTRRQLYDVTQLDGIARQISKQLRKQLKYSAECFFQRRNELRRELLAF